MRLVVPADYADRSQQEGRIDQMISMPHKRAHNALGVVRPAALNQRRNRVIIFSQSRRDGRGAIGVVVAGDGALGKDNQAGAVSGGLGHQSIDAGEVAGRIAQIRPKLGRGHPNAQ